MNAELEPTGVLGFLGWPCICFAIMMFDLQHGYKQRPTEVSALEVPQQCKTLHYMLEGCLRSFRHTKETFYPLVSIQYGV